MKNFTANIPGGACAELVSHVHLSTTRPHRKSFAIRKKGVLCSGEPESLATLLDLRSELSVCREIVAVTL